MLDVIDIFNGQSITLGGLMSDESQTMTCILNSDVRLYILIWQLTICQGLYYSLLNSSVGLF